MSSDAPPTRPAAPAVAGDAAMLRSVVDALPALVSTWDADERNLMLNATALPWFGLTVEQARGKPLRECVGEADYAVIATVLPAVRRGETRVLHRTIDSADGRVRHIETTIKPTMVDGVLGHMTVLSTDVTQQTEAVADLDQAQRLAAVGSWTWTPDRPEEMVWSRQMYRLAGKDPATFEPTVASWSALVHPEDFVTSREVANSPITLDPSSPDNDYETGFRIVLDDGEVRHVYSRGSTVRGPDGQVVMIRGTAQDETDVRRTADELATANTLLSDMMGMIGHDVRQPLAVLTGYLEQVTEDWTDLAEDDRQKLVRTALDAGHRAHALIDDILMMVNLDSGSLTARPGTIRLGEFVREVVLAAGLDLEVDVRREGLVVVDPFHLRQIVTNLVLNAVRYGRDPIQVVVDADDVNGTVSVTDAGDGVPEDFVPHLFERFSRATTGVAATKSGTGFGLYIVTQLLEANGGQVTYQPADPHGARFTVTLPLLRH